MAQSQGPRWEMVDDIPAFPHEHIIADTVPDAMKCGISLDVMEDPSLVLPCGHSFDYSQINRYLHGKWGRERNCPNCRGWVEEVQREPGFRAAIRQTIRTRCVVQGCPEEMKVDALDGHVKHQCEYTRFRCLQPGLNGRPCGYITTRDLQEYHNDSKCPNRLVVCQHCGKQVIASKRDNHEEVCHERMVECQCLERYRQGDRAQHRRVCGEEQIRCPVYKDLIKRRQLEAHNKDPEVMGRHIVALSQEKEKENRRMRVAEEARANTLIRALESIDRVEERLDDGNPLVVAIKGMVGREGWRVMVRGEDEKPGTAKVVVGLIKCMVERVKETEGGEGGGHYGGVVAAALKSIRSILWRARQAAAYRARQAAAPFSTQGAQEVVVWAMRSCPTNRDVQYYGCGVVTNLVYHDQNRGRAMVQAGVCPLVVESMRAFPNDLVLQKVAMMAVRSLASIEEGKRLLVEADACDVVEEAQERFPQDEQMYQARYWSLVNL